MEFPIIIGALLLAAAIVAHGHLASRRPLFITIAAPATPPSPSNGQENDPMPPGPQTEAIIQEIGSRVSAAINSGVQSSLSAISTSLAEASASQAAVASSLAAADDSETAGEIDTALTNSGAPAITSSLSQAQ